MSIENDLIIISAEEEGERLDKILAMRFGGKNSRTYFQYLIEEGLVRIDGKPVKKRLKPSQGDEVEVHFVASPQIDLTPENIPLEILYEDDDLLVVDKPAGMVVHPAPGNWSGTFVNALLYHCKITSDASTVRPGIVHRLDKDTSGVLIAAKHAQAHQKLIELFSKRQVQKEYLAVCIGNPGNVEIRTLIGRHPIHRKRMAVVEEGGKQAVTHCQTVSHDGKLSVARIFLETGRTHQIRVHMKHQGTPVLGDALYGNTQQNKKYGVERQMLHASRLRFIHPMTGVELDISAPFPEDISKFLS